jgi:hypothetical protein
MVVAFVAWGRMLELNEMLLVKKSKIENDK